MTTNACTYSNRTATANIKATNGILMGFYVNSTTGGTIIFYDSATTTTTVPITGTITPAIGWHSLGSLYFRDGLYIVVANTLNVTLVYV